MQAPRRLITFPAKPQYGHSGVELAHEVANSAQAKSDRPGFKINYRNKLRNLSSSVVGHIHTVCVNKPSVY